MGRLKGSRIVDGVYYNPKEARQLKGAKLAKPARVQKEARLKAKYAANFASPSYESKVSALVKLVRDVLTGLLKG